MYKAGEKFGKGIGRIIKGNQDANFSVQDPLTYSRRFMRYVLTNIEEEESSIFKLLILIIILHYRYQF